MSRLARGLLHLGEVLLAAGATELYPSVVGGTVVRQVDDLGHVVGPGDPGPHEPDDRAPHVDACAWAKTAAAPEPTASAGCGATGTCVSTTRSLLPDAPGVNPQAAIMAIATRNCDQFLAET